jgi:3-hydroxybutyryl-CoA dehydrogenase
MLKINELSKEFFANQFILSINILNIMHQGFGNPKYSPCPLLVNMVTAGKLGKKSGEGFYSYHAGTKEMVVSSKFM